MSSELHMASVDLEHAIRGINNTDRGHEDCVDADLIDHDIGLRNALSVAIRELLAKIKKLENK